MKGLSLTQPWAHGITIGEKHWETRSWATKFRGTFCLHAAKGFPGYAKQFAMERGFDVKALPLGRIIAVCDLTDCVPTLDIAPQLSETELAYGDYSPGRYAFKIENVQVLEEPVFVSGSLGFWSVEWEVANDVLRGAKHAL